MDRIQETVGKYGQGPLVADEGMRHFTEAILNAFDKCCLWSSPSDLSIPGGCGSHFSEHFRSLVAENIGAVVPEQQSGVIHLRQGRAERYSVRLHTTRKKLRNESRTEGVTLEDDGAERRDACKRLRRLYNNQSPFPSSWRSAQYRKSARHNHLASLCGSERLFIDTPIEVRVRLVRGVLYDSGHLCTTFCGSVPMDCYGR